MGKIIKVRSIEILDRAEADWRETMNTNYENHAVKIIRSDDRMYMDVINERGERISFKVVPKEAK